jgi:phytoene synthase
MDGFQLAQAITKKHAKTFYFASRFLRKEKRNAAYAVYVPCWLSDEAVDAGKHTRPEQILNRLKENIDSVYQNRALENTLWEAFRQTVNKYGIPQKYFTELIAGMYMDLSRSRYKNFAELYEYCYRAAGVVGLIMLEIFGYKDLRAQSYAVDLGIALQLTNILRDVKEDYLRGRIYLPEDEMKRFNVAEGDIAEGRANDNFKALLKFQIARARQYYANSKLGLEMVNDLNSRFVVSAIADNYSGILNSIEKSNYDVFSRRAHVGILGKITAIFKIILKGEYR